MPPASNEDILKESVPLEEANTGQNEGSVKNKIEQELAEEKEYMDKVDTLSGKEEFIGEVAYTEKLKEIEESLRDSNAISEAQSKIYREKISNFLDKQEKVLGTLNQKIDSLGADRYSFKNDLEAKINELAENAEVVRKHLYYLDQALGAKK